MMNLREIAAKKLTEQLLGNFAEEYKRMWHNARLTGNSFPDFANDEEQEDYYNCINDELGRMIDDLQEELKEQFDVDWKIYTWGRMGATIAPDGFSTHGNGSSFNQSLDTSTIVNTWDLPDDDMLLAGDDGPATWTDAYHTAKAHLEAFQYINKEVLSWAAADLVAWWEDMKAGNEWTYGDDEEEWPEEFDELEEAAA
jgi:hypothetical protein